MRDTRPIEKTGFPFPAPRFGWGELREDKLHGNDRKAILRTSYEIIKIALSRNAPVLDTKVEIIWKLKEILFHFLPG